MTPPDNTKRPNELHILQARLLQLQRDREELQRLLNSRSWKLTAPLRRFTEWGRKVWPAHQAKEQTSMLPRGGIARHALYWKQATPCAPLLGQGNEIHLWTAQQGNAFFHEISQLLKCGLEDAGIPCKAFSASSMEDCLQQDDAKAAIRLIIAPHEFYHFIPEAEYWPLNRASLDAE